MDKIVLIGGSPTAGKSYTARAVAEHLKLPWISTDTIRGQMKKIVRKEDFPRLFFHSDTTPVEYLTKYSAKEIVKNQGTESIDVWKGVKALIETDCVWRSYIVEGVAVLPRFVSELSVEEKDIKAIFLIVLFLKLIPKIIVEEN